MTDKEAKTSQFDSIADLAETIWNAVSADDLIIANSQTPLLLTKMITNREKPQNINKLTAQISDSILVKFIELAMEEIGPPPAAFSFIVFGSVGREEQTLKTDQDNAIIYEDIETERGASVREYFLTLGKKVCTWLDNAGYTFCEGRNMAMNPVYCQPLSVWKQYFSTWVFSVTDNDLLRVKIFFDFRNVYGDARIEEDLRDHLNQITFENPRFFQVLARNILQMEPPIGFLGRFIVESAGPKRGAFNIKNAMVPIVDFARIYAMKNKIRTANTIQRLEALCDLKILNDMGLEMIKTYANLMQMRLNVQARAIISGRSAPSNYIFPNSLTSSEQKSLKECFAHTKNFKQKLSYDFLGRLNG
jgi:CBS domain-containing protein